MLENAARGARRAKRHDHQVRSQQASAPQAGAPQAGAQQAGAQQAGACGYPQPDDDSDEDSDGEEDKAEVWRLLYARNPAPFSPCLTCGSADYNLGCKCCLAQMPSQPGACKYCQKWTKYAARAPPTH
jgi:hypothetical protein